MLPIYNINIDFLDEETGCYTISLVEMPAVETEFLQFNQDEKLKFSLDEPKHIVSGVALRADFPIYRNNSRYGEHYVVFTKDAIKTIIEKYSKYGFHNFVNIEHDENNYVHDIVMLESYIIDKERGICPKEFSNIEDGSWMVSYKVNNLHLWEKIKNGEVKGFSIEGVFHYTDTETSNSTEMSSQENPVDSTIIIDTKSSFDDFINELISE